MPDVGSQPVSLPSLLGCDGQQWIKDFVNSKVLPKQDAAAAKHLAGFRRPYNDPVLNSDEIYGRLIQRMMDSGVVDLTVNPQEVVQSVRVFAVRMKNDRQRLVVDARGSNFWFSKPGHVHLPTGSALSMLELGPDEELYVADADIANAFYNTALPAELRKYSAMRGLQARHAGVTSVNGQAVSATQLVWPRLAVLPMGWSHALELCRRVHEHPVRDSGEVSPEQAVVSRRRPPHLALGPTLSTSATSSPSLWSLTEPTACATSPCVVFVLLDRRCTSSTT
jgi:hypothetical protein